ncbi:MAG: hypothetical protein Kow0074_01450 [Candidatus Zixiibacteriota bacterium]
MVVMAFVAGVVYAQDLDKIREILSQGRFEEAVSSLTAHIDEKPKDGEAYYLLGEAYAGLNQWDKAAEAFAVAADRKYERDLSTYRQAKALIELGKVEEASALVEKPLQKAKDPKVSAMFKNIKGLAAYAQGNYSKAQEWQLGARYDDESNMQYRKDLGDAYYAGQVYPLAITEYEAVLAADSTQLDVMYKLGEAYYQSRRLTEARELFANLIQSDSTYDEAYFRLANIYMMAASSRPRNESTDLYRAALSLYRKVREVDPQADPVLVAKNIATVYYIMNWHDSAYVEIQRALEAGATDPELNFYLGRSAMLLGEYQTAVEALQNYVSALESQQPPHEWTKDDAEIFWRLAVSMEQLNDTTYLPQIADSYRRAVELDPSNERAIGGLALTYHKLGRYAEAAVQFEKLVVSHPNDARHLFNASLPYMQLENNEKAVEYLMRAAEADTTADQSYRERGYKLAAPRLIKMQKLAQAQKAYRWLIQREPNVCDHYQWFGYTYFALKDWANAATQLQKAYNCIESLKENPCGYNELRWWLAYSLYETGKKDASYQLCEKVVECDAKMSDAQDLMNRIDDEIVEEN